MKRVAHKSDRDRLVEAAHRAVALAITTGDLLPPSAMFCMDCGDTAECYDHRDYNQPLMVVAVCKGCNNRRGPGLPLPSKSDGMTHKNGAAGNVGRCWESLDGGEGYEPLVANLSISIEINDMPDLLYGLWYGSYGASMPDIGEKSWKARADWFKARDPWCV